jgi:hypothetical protein
VRRSAFGATNTTVRAPQLLRDGMFKGVVPDE